MENKIQLDFAFKKILLSVFFFFSCHSKCEDFAEPDMIQVKLHFFVLPVPVFFQNRKLH